MQKKLIIICGILGCATVGFAGLSGWLWYQRGQARMKTQDLEQAATDQTQRFEKLQRETGELRKKAGNLQKETTETKPAATVAEAGTEPAAKPQEQRRRGGNWGTAWREVMNDPAMKELMRIQQRDALEKQYATLFKELGLTPEQREAFLAAMADGQTRQWEGMDWSGGDGRGDEASREARTQKWAEEKKKQDEAIKGLLGETGFAKYQEYTRTTGERMVLDEFRNQLARTGTPLNDSQSGDLLKIMSEENAKLPKSYTMEGATEEWLRNPSTFMSEDNINQWAQTQQDMYQRVVNRAESVLTTDQLRSFATHLEKQITQAEVGMKIGSKFMSLRRPRDSTGEGGGASPQ